ncbi:hypothetical protein HJFPF1_03405 [Paramyrothecium foliicola]|nr:hypothetical protein HJFPF1_03405 [Paramyrothecium foliicola]
MYTFGLSVFGLIAGAIAKEVWTTPHDKYSSSIGVLGCKVNTNRIAYWPGSVDCDNICVKLSHQTRSVYLLRVDQSGGAYDISYDAWAFLQTGDSAIEDPISGGSVAMDYEEVDASECADLIYTKDSKLPLSASNSMNYLSSCLAQPNSWVAKNHVLFNICDAICTLGFDEECSLDLSTSNQPSCPHTLGLTSKLTTTPVYDIEYTSGKKVVAGTGEEAPSDGKGDEGAKNEDTAGGQQGVEDEEYPDSQEEGVQESHTNTLGGGDSPISAEPSATTSASQTGGIFQELPTISQEPIATTSAAGSAIGEGTSSAHIKPTSWAVVSTATSSSVLEIPTSASAPSPPGGNSTATSSITTSFAKPSTTEVLTTFSVATVSVERTPSSTSPPQGQETPQPESAGRPLATVPTLALLMSVIACSLRTWL